MKKTVGIYLLEQLYQKGVQHIFGIPGDYILRFDKVIEKYPTIQFINATRENTAGYMADAYARIKGLGVACITYGVGINIVNALSQAYVENSPLVVISGAAGLAELEKEIRLHHLFNKSLHKHLETTQLDIFRNITIAQTVLNEPCLFASEIDRVLTACLVHKKPVYIEIPRDQVDAEMEGGRLAFMLDSASDPFALQEAIEDVTQILQKSERPVIWVGHEVLRYGLADAVLEFAQKFSIPIVSTLLGKAAIDEWDSHFLGVYLGGMSHSEVQNYVNSADCLLRLGVLLNDLDTGIFTAKFHQKNQIIVINHEVQVNHHYYSEVLLKDFVGLLKKIELQKTFDQNYPSNAKRAPKAFVANHQRLTVDRLFDCLQTHLTSEHLVISDIGDSLFGSAELILHQNAYMACAHFASLSFAVPAAIGAQLANPRQRPIVLVGDGAFQMSAMELSTAVRYGLDPIVIVLNNHGYGTERPIIEGSYNDVHDWNYVAIPQVLEGGKGVRVTTEEELNQALQTAVFARGTFYLIEVDLDKNDHSQVLKRFGELMNQHA
ncbi:MULTISPECIES: alpha-keto acid decarboxylase family protein [Parachlamydia]|jgi:indolepyruvate decarboxylase|uniref:Indole-3-pyruvate decarboxylase n=2 Tax=Parachlamydia acanthamoebae TaxID=83552 RepID=F8KXU2_PARAV|nr:thiamine pyrophosphate-dependent enzyme [Parachlamydia acanthamoebae]EFB40444.1 hypothetical protein pah_c205o097 [Parachlamydia acanthamoebae str. Hall's coccus]CCB85672.1 indole-3-pyruvate decarboxylase [Parachlamydia acanthamoebae UV-7]